MITAIILIIVFLAIGIFLVLASDRLTFSNKVSFLGLPTAIVGGLCIAIAIIIIVAIPYDIADKKFAAKRIMIIKEQCNLEFTVEEYVRNEKLINAIVIAKCQKE